MNFRDQENSAEGLMPNLFAVGAAKCGTTTLYDYLRFHSDIFMCPVKEPHHFCTDINEADLCPAYLRGIEMNPLAEVSQGRVVHIAHVKDRAQYLSLYQGGRDRAYRGECSNGYMLSRTAAAEIKAASPNAKIIMILRHPVERLTSHYVSQIRISKVKKSLYDSVMNDFNADKKGWGINNLYVELGLYAEAVSSYFNLFGREHVHVERFEEWCADTPAAVRRILMFLELNPDDGFHGVIHSNKGSRPISPVLNEVLFKSGVKRWLARHLPCQVLDFGKKMYYRKIDAKSLLSPEEREELCGFFSKDIDRLEGLLKWDLSAWRK